VPFCKYHVNVYLLPAKVPTSSRRTLFLPMYLMSCYWGVMQYPARCSPNTPPACHAAPYSLWWRCIRRQSSDHVLCRWSPVNLITMYIQRSPSPPNTLKRPLLRMAEWWQSRDPRSSNWIEDYNEFSTSKRFANFLYSASASESLSRPQAHTTKSSTSTCGIDNGP